jgi:tripartite-type tricarboxylate transporter receptor subunit TctC
MRKIPGLFLALTLAFACGPSAAQTYPVKPVRLAVGFPPGGVNDIIGRIVAAKLSEGLGQTVIVENKPGGNGVIGTDYVAKAAPDGYTLLIGTIGTMVFNPGLYERLPYDPVKDFIAITRFASGPLVFAVHPSVAATSIRDLIALAKAKPGQLFYGSGAAPHHVSTEWFKKENGVNMVHVAYKGGSQSVMAAVAGEVQVVVSSIADVLPQLQAGRLRALAVSGSNRSFVIPDTPTLAESGVPNYEQLVLWTGLFAPAGTPRAIIDRLYGEVSIVLRQDSVRERLAALSYDVGGMPPAEFGAAFRAELEKWTKLTREFNIRAN